MSREEVIMLGLAAAAFYGMSEKKKNIWDILSWAGNSGDVNTITRKNTDVGMPNVDPNWPGSGKMVADSQIKPYPPPGRDPLQVELPVHPSMSSRLTRELR